MPQETTSLNGRAVRAAFKKNDVFSFPHSQCSECGANYHYVRVGDQLLRDLVCKCLIERSKLTIIPVSWDTMAENIRKSRGKARKEFQVRLGI